MGYDIKFKRRVIEYKNEGHTYKETCKIFKISEMTLTRWIKKEKEGKLEEIKKPLRKPKKIYPDKLVKYINENPDAYLSEIAQELHSCSSIKSAQKTWYNTKKKTTSYKEQCPIKVKKYLNEIKDISKDDIVYIDETGIQGYIYREYGRALKGKKVYDKIAGKKYHRINIVSRKYSDKIISPLVYEKILMKLYHLLLLIVDFYNIVIIIVYF